MNPDRGPATTAGTIALGNLEARIDGHAWQATRGQLTVGDRADLVELDRLARARAGPGCRRRAGGGARGGARRPGAGRGPVLHRARQDGGRLPPVRVGPDRPRYRGRAGGRSRDPGRGAGRDLSGARTLRRGARDPSTGRGESCRLQRPGRARRTLRRARGDGRGGPLVQSRRVAATTASRRSRWRCWSSNAASCGWSTDDLRRARAWCDAAVRRVPAYVPAQGHLAELDAAQGETAGAIARLRPLALASDDPDYATQLARILGDAGHTEEAQTWRGRAETRYEELLARHPDAFADHAAEFWLTIGGDPDRALRLARQNLALRQTPRARALVRRSSAHPPG